MSSSEYALIGCVDGTSFVDVTDPYKPSVLGFLRTHTANSLWRDIKVRILRGPKFAGGGAYKMPLHPSLYLLMHFTTSEADCVVLQT